MIEYTVKVYNDGDCWYLNGDLHRENGPAIEWANGDKEWWINGKRHREDGPAIECNSVAKSWWINGKRHREDGPAVESLDGSKLWYLNGDFHREDEFNLKMNPKKELTVKEVEDLLGYEVKIVKG